MLSKNYEAPTARTVEASNLPVNLSEKTNMNSVQSNELTFHNVTFNPIVADQQVWLTSAELAKALKYSSTKSISTLYSRNADEFTPAITQVIEMMTSGNYRKKVRVFSIRGAHLVAMFATTPVAKEFRRWVLDILDREVAQGNVNPAFDFDMAAHNARAINIHLRAIKEMWRGGLADGLRLIGYKDCGNISERLADMTFFTAPLESSLRKYEKKGKIH